MQKCTSRHTARFCDILCLLGASVMPCGVWFGLGDVTLCVWLASHSGSQFAESCVILWLSDRLFVKSYGSLLNTVIVRNIDCVLTVNL